MSLYLLDAYNLLFRSFCSLPSSILGPDEKPINAIYGMLGFLLRLQREAGAGHLVAAFDTPEVPTFRHRLYPEYQAQRGPMGGEKAGDFERQIHLAQRLLPALGITCLTAPGFEADDILGTLAQRAKGGKTAAHVVSTDRDVLQLVGGGITVVTPDSTLKRFQNDEDVRARLGVTAGGVPAWKSLAGDASDNIPGVSGIGAKTASRLVNEFGTLDRIYESLHLVEPRSRKLLIAGRKQANLFLEVVTIRTDLEIDLDPNRLDRHHLHGETRVRPLIDRAFDATASESTA
ncbi:MAG: 5'-3' exonuclease [Chloroflexota bacterium]|nr:MAG: hypothetical protein DLM70_02270 [Chloroflexota bacterium]